MHTRLETCGQMLEPREYSVFSEAFPGRCHCYNVFVHERFAETRLAGSTGHQCLLTSKVSLSSLLAGLCRLTQLIRAWLSYIHCLHAPSDSGVPCCCPGHNGPSSEESSWLPSFPDWIGRCRCDPAR